MEGIKQTSTAEVVLKGQLPLTAGAILGVDGSDFESLALWRQHPFLKTQNAQYPDNRKTTDIVQDFKSRNVTNPSPHIHSTKHTLYSPNSKINPNQEVYIKKKREARGKQVQ